MSAAERVNLTCPADQWASLRQAAAAAATPPAAGLDPCAAEVVTSGPQLLEALQRLQHRSARVLLTLDANISLPAEPSPQRGLLPVSGNATAAASAHDDMTPLAWIYRNVSGLVPGLR